MRAERPVRLLLTFFGLVYFAQGLAGGLLIQPLTAYLKGLGLASDAATRALALAALPWMIKPLYGLIADFVPLFGSHRKSYIVLMAAVATAGYALLAGASSPAVMLGLLVMATVGVAATDVAVDALMVQQGQRTGALALFQARQWTCLNLAAVVAGLLGGSLTDRWSPEVAIRIAAAVLAAVTVAVAAATVWCVEEPGAAADPARRERPAVALRGAVRSRALWAVAALLIVWNATPRFSTPLYYHMTDELRIDQAVLGQLNALGAVGAAVGAWLYGRYVASRLSPVALIPFCTGLTVALTLGYLCLVNVPSAAVLSLVGGLISVFPLLMLFNLAAAVCPPQAAGFTFAVLMSLYSTAGQVGAVTGAHLYEHVFGRQLSPLIWTAAAVSLLAIAWMPIFRRVRVSPPAAA